MNRKWILTFAVFLSGIPMLIASQKPDTTWVYKTVDDQKLEMQVFLPEGYEEAKHKFPAFVVFHGGSWRKGDPSMHYPDCVYWASRGMVAVSVRYRLQDKDHVEVPLECVKDAKAAVRFLRANAERLKIDRDRIVAAGGSAGGQLAAATATIHDPRSNHTDDDLNISSIPNAVILYNPYWKTGCPDYLSPPQHVVKGLPPFITFLGDEDSAIPVELVLDFHRKLEASDVLTEFYVGLGGKHGFCNGRNRNNPFFYWSLELEDAFLVQHGILSGEALVVRPVGVRELRLEADYLSF